MLQPSCSNGVTDSLLKFVVIATVAMVYLCGSTYACAAFRIMHYTLCIIDLHFVNMYDYPIIRLIIRFFQKFQILYGSRDEFFRISNYFSNTFTVDFRSSQTLDTGRLIITFEASLLAQWSNRVSKPHESRH